MAQRSRGMNNLEIKQPYWQFLFHSLCASPPVRGVLYSNKYFATIVCLVISWKCGTDEKKKKVSIGSTGDNGNSAASLSTQDVHYMLKDSPSPLKCVPTEHDNFNFSDDFIFFSDKKCASLTQRWMERESWDFVMGTSKTHCPLMVMSLRRYAQRKTP